MCSLKYAEVNEKLYSCQIAHEKKILGYESEDFYACLHLPFSNSEVGNHF